ncbi:MAG: hypothetical protein ACJAYO_002433 [Thalassolituus oleivorans]
MDQRVADAVNVVTHVDSLIWKCKTEGSLTYFALDI